MIQVKKLVKRFGLKTVLKGMDFSVEEGEFVALLGPNGAGKSTFLRILSSLTRPSIGAVRVAGFELPKEAAEVRQRLGVVSHQPLLYVDLTAAENLKFYGKMYNIANIDERISEVLGMVGLTKRRDDLVRTYSRGMQQRLAIGRAIIHDPDVVLFDEPYTGLDQDASAMLDGVLRTVAAKGRTVVMTSHDLGRTEDLATRFDVLTRGKIAASATKADFGSGNLLSYYKSVIAEGAKQ